MKNSIKTKLSTIAMALFALHFVDVASAATITWDGGAGDGMWSTQGNWDTDGLPTEFDIAKFTVSNTVVLTENVSVSGLNFSTVNPVFEGAGFTLHIGDGNISGGYPIFNCNLATESYLNWSVADSYGKKTVVNGTFTSTAAVVFGGNQNKNLAFHNAVSVPVLTNALSSLEFDGSFQSDIEICQRNNWTDGNGNRSTLRFNSGALASLDKVAITTGPGGGIVCFRNSTDSTAESRAHLKKLVHECGHLTLYSSYYGGTNIVTIDDFARKPGAYVTLNNRKDGGSTAFSAGVNAGIIVDGASNNYGFWKPWCMQSYFLVKVNGNGALEVCSNGDYAAFSGDIGLHPDTIYRNTTSGSIELTGNTSVRALLSQCGHNDLAFNLGDHDFRIESGNLAVIDNGAREFNARTGRLVFGGEDLIFYVAGNSNLMLNASIACDVAQPSIMAMLSGNGLEFHGRDEIGTYGALFAESGNTAQHIAFAGESDRTFNGDINGRFHIYKYGTGNLTFNGKNQRRGGGLYVYEGSVTIGNDAAPAASLVTNGAAVVVKEGVSWTSCVLWKDGILCGDGTYNGGIGGNQHKNGGLFAGGAPGALGTLSINGNFTPAQEFGFKTKIDGSNASLVSLVGSSRQFQLSQSGSTCTVHVSNISTSKARIRPETRYRVFSWQESSKSSCGNTNFSHVWKVVNDTPRTLDASGAVVGLDTTEKCIYVTGLKSINPGLVVTIR